MTDVDPIVATTRVWFTWADSSDTATGTVHSICAGRADVSLDEGAMVTVDVGHLHLLGAA